jgi:hypothetical protein
MRDKMIKAARQALRVVARILEARLPMAVFLDSSAAPRLRNDK